MKRRITHALIVVATTAAMGWAAVSCADDPLAGDDFLPIITNTWHNVLDDTHTFDLESLDDSTAAGFLTGQEDHPIEGLSDLDGTFNHSSITMVVHRPAGDFIYAGQFVHRDTMVLTSSAGPVSIAR